MWWSVRFHKTVVSRGIWVACVPVLVCGASLITLPVAGAAGQTALKPALQTPVMDGSGDIADDSAIYVNGAKTWVVADDKDDSEGGVYVYDVKGKQVGEKYAAGKVGNIDLRANVVVGGKPIVLVGANNRTDDSINLWSLNASTGALTEIEAEGASTGSSGYGFCLGMLNKKPLAFVTGKDGSVQQFSMTATGSGFTFAKQKTFKQPNSSEGCVFDDAAGVLYTGEDGDGTASSGTKSCGATTLPKVRRQRWWTKPGRGIWRVT